jgi:hypothetical protein
VFPLRQGDNAEEWFIAGFAEDDGGVTFFTVEADFALEGAALDFGASARDEVELLLRLNFEFLPDVLGHERVVRAAVEKKLDLGRFVGRPVTVASTYVRPIGMMSGVEFRVTNAIMGAGTAIERRVRLLALRASNRIISRREMAILNANLEIPTFALLKQESARTG